MQYGFYNAGAESALAGLPSSRCLVRLQSNPVKPCVEPRVAGHNLSRFVFTWSLPAIHTVHSKRQSSKQQETYRRINRGALPTTSPASGNSANFETKLRHAQGSGRSNLESCGNGLPQGFAAP